MTVKKEKLELTNVSIANMIDHTFYETLKHEFENNLTPITVVFVNKKTGIPLLVAHENQKDVEGNIAHILCQDETLLDKFVKLLERRE